MTPVSVIIVNYNGKGLIKSCLKALEGQSLKSFEVVIVDNGSLDGSVSEIKEFLQESLIICRVKFVALERNIGFAAGNLIGLQHAGGEYIALLNNDAVPDARWLEELVNAMQSHPEVGICASKIVVYGTDIIDSAGDGFSTILKGFKRGEGEKSLLYTHKEYIFGACAGAALYRRTMIDEIGFLDEDFFLIHEDTDLNLRAHLYCWKVLYVPDAIVYHKVRSTIGMMSDKAIYYTLRNSEFVIIKNVSFVLLLRCLVGFLMRIGLEFIYFGLQKKKLKLYCRAKKDFLKMLPRMFRKRAMIMQNRKANNFHLFLLMTSVREMKFFRSKIKKFFCE